MTITGMAKQLGVSTMTIYRRAKKKGVLLDDLRDGETGQLTAAGVAVIASLFDATTPQTALTGDATQIQPRYNGDAQTAPQGASTASAAVLQAKLDGMTALVEHLTSERDDLRQQVAALTAALAAEQADRQAERRLLTGDVGEGAQPRRRWWPWTRR
jgi:AcrR family transcriptional regulator